VSNSRRASEDETTHWGRRRIRGFRSSAGRAVAHRQGQSNANDHKEIVLSSTDRKSIFQSSPILIFSILAVISLAIWWRALASSFALALRDDQYTHLLLILPVSVALIFIDWKSPEPATKSSLRIGSSLLVAAVFAFITVRLGAIPLRPDEQLSVNMLALVIWWMGAFIFSFGTRAFRRALFPLCFLLWIVPLPQLLLNSIVRLLQEGSVTSAHLFFAAFGVPVTEDRTFLTIPGLTIEVARECSSIRSSLMLVVTTMVVAQMILRSAWRKAFVIALAIPLSVAKNGLRIFVLAMLSTHVDRNFLTGSLHHEGGVIYFVIALVAIFLLIWVARHGEQKRKAPE
jgi:exosortase